MNLVKNMNLDSHRCQWHRERIEQWLSGVRVAPITIDMALSKACNYSCVYCYSKLQRNDHRVLTKKVIFNFLDDCAEAGVKAISIVSDGESSMNPNLYDFIQHGKENGIDMGLGTNGYLLKTDKLADILPCLTYLRFNTSATGDRYKEVHGSPEGAFQTVCETIEDCVKIKKAYDLPLTIGLQMVLLPEYIDEVEPLIQLGKHLGVDYVVIKHCSDNEKGDLGVDYSQYERLTDRLRQAEKLSDREMAVVIKWSKILTGSKRRYRQCYATALMLQMSGNGLVAPCGSFFAKEYEKYHIGNIIDMRFRDILTSDRYWEVMWELRSQRFDARSMCATLCLQDKVNEFIYDLQQGVVTFQEPRGAKPDGVNFL